jgi:curved DNA-binding protein
VDFCVSFASQVGHMTYKDYYKVLGVERNAPAEVIKQAYKRLAMQYHPDRNPGDQAAEDRFKAIAEAKEVLLNPVTRRRYDQLGTQWQQYARAGHAQESGGSDLNSIFTTFFEEVFGSRNGPRRGKNFEANIKISLDEAYQGVNDVIRYEGNRLRIHIKPGIRDGQVLRLRGKGGAGRNGGTPGDLYLTVKIKPHERFTRQEDDLYLDLKTDLYTAVLGGKVQVPSLKGNMSVTLPPGTQSGERLKLRGLGMPVFDRAEQHGDLYLTLQVQLPEKLSPEEKSLFQQLAQLRRK